MDGNKGSLGVLRHGFKCFGKRIYAVTLKRELQRERVPAVRQHLRALRGDSGDMLTNKRSVAERKAILVG